MAEFEGTSAATQPKITDHTVKQEKPEPVVPYSDALFRDAAIQWLVATDQVSSRIINATSRLTCTQHNSLSKLLTTRNSKK